MIFLPLLTWGLFFIIGACLDDTHIFMKMSGKQSALFCFVTYVTNNLFQKVVFISLVEIFFNHMQDGVEIAHSDSLVK